MNIRKYLLSEVMGYTIKPKDKKIIKAFIDGAKEGEGKALWIDGDYLFGPNQSTKDSAVAQRGKDVKVTAGRAYGNVSQTWKNYVEKMSK